MVDAELSERLTAVLTAAPAPMPVAAIIAAIKKMGGHGGLRKVELNAILYTRPDAFAHVAWTHPPHWFPLGVGSRAEEIGRRASAPAEAGGRDGADAAAVARAELAA